MGYGSYSASDWSKLKQSRNLTSNKRVEEVFTKTQCDPKFDPKYIGTRECFDSADHPSTTPIVVGLDVTGSMGYLAVEVATKALNELIMKLYSTGAVEDPALMCAAYGDYRDNSPLQVTQFESDIRIAEQLLELYFENAGSGQVVPTCLWEFLSRHTNIDAIKKRGKKGFVFTIGDDADIRASDVENTISRVIGDEIGSASRESLYDEVSEKFHVFHITLGGRNKNIFLKGHTLEMSPENLESIPEVIISIIQLQNGRKIDEILEQWDEIKRPVINSALSQLAIYSDDEGISL